MNRVKKIISSIILLLVIGVTIFSNGCNTMRGAGKDIERGGEEIQEATR